MRKFAWLAAKLAAVIAIVSILLVVLSRYNPRVFSTLFGERGVRVTEDVAYGSDKRQVLDIYRPPEGVGERPPIIVFLYGGSWSSGDKFVYGFVGRALAARGYTTVIPDYRLYPQVQFPRSFEDAAAAYTYAERTLSAPCARPRPMILMGHSAGGHMAAMLALNPAYIKAADASASRPAAWIGLAGPYTFEATKWPTTKDSFATAVAMPQITKPTNYIDKSAPPALLLHGLADDLVQLKNTRDMAAALMASGNQVETTEFAGIGHVGLVLALSRPFRWRAPVLNKLLDFIGRTDRATVSVDCPARP